MPWKTKLFGWCEQGEGRAEYGELLVKQLAVDLTKHFGRGLKPRSFPNCICEAVLIE